MGKGGEAIEGSVRVVFNGKGFNGRRRRNSSVSEKVVDTTGQLIGAIES